MDTAGKARLPSLMRKLVIYFMVIIVMMFSLNAYSIYQFKFFYNDFYTQLKQLVDMHSISLQMDELYQEVDNYLHSGNRDYIQNYRGRFTALEKDVAMLRSSAGSDTYYKYKDLGNMLVTFNEKSINLFAEYDKKVSNIYLNQNAAELSRHKEYIQDEVKELLLIQLKAVQAYYSGFGKMLLSGENLMYILTVLITLLCLFFALQFSRQISIPIHQLVIRLQKVARGKLDVDQVRLKTNDEISILVDSFNHMIIELRSLIERMKEKANVERQLKEQEIKNLEISNLLKQSELNFLQSQINPHFLFNTLNSISALADIEDASQTKGMIDCMSGILRYNLKKLNLNVTLEEEVEIVSNYLHIQSVRFGNRLEFVTEIDEKALAAVVPSMILQPFVENSIIHGLEPKEGKGILQMKIVKTEKGIEIEIWDNGVGIPSEKLEKILDTAGASEDSSRGIGVVNVLRRLEISYGYNPVSISSQPAQGTTVKMVLPEKFSY